MKRYESKCPTCSGNYKKNTPRPYGAKGTNPYCYRCDRDYVYSVSKSSERHKARKSIKKQIDDN